MQVVVVVDNRRRGFLREERQHISTLAQTIGKYEEVTDPS
jgi:hypothetical protein